MNFYNKGLVTKEEMERLEKEICKSCHNIKNDGTCNYHGMWSNCKFCGYGIAGQFEVKDICEACR